MKLNYRVGTFRQAGLQAKWGKSNSGSPCIFARNPNATTVYQRDTWWLCSLPMWETMQKVGVVEGYDRHTLLGDVFSLPVRSR